MFIENRLMLFNFYAGVKTDIQAGRQIDCICLVRLIVLVVLAGEKAER